MDAPETIAPEVEPAPEAPPQDARTPPVQPFDFRHPMFLSSAEWRKLRMEVEEFVESSGALLSTYLRLDFGLQLGKLRTLSFNELTASLPTPTHVVLFKTDPLRGISFLEVRSGIAQAIVDRMLGGPGNPSAPERTLTDMETALMDQFVHLILEEWCKQWSKLQSLEPGILGHENNPKFLQCATGSTTMLLLSLEARLGECEGQIQLAVPFATIEPLVNKLASMSSAPAAQPANPSQATTRWVQQMDNVPVQMCVQWPSVRMPARDLLGLQIGSILDLKAEDSERLELRVGKVVKFRGRLGTREKKWAVQISEVSKL